MFTGNNVQLGGDTGRRSLVCRFEPSEERPELRSDFRHENLLGHVRAHRPALLSAALSIAHGYVRAGRPGASERPWGSFDAWASLVAPAIRWVGGSDVLECRGEDAQGPSPEALALASLFDVWGALLSAEEGHTARALAEALERPAGGLQGLRVAHAVRDALADLGAPTKPHEAAPSPQAIGYVLRKHCGRPIGGRKLVRLGLTHGNVVRWRLVEAPGGMMGMGVPSSRCL